MLNIDGGSTSFTVDISAAFGGMILMGVVTGRADGTRLQLLSVLFFSATNVRLKQMMCVFPMIHQLTSLSLMTC